MNYNHASRVRTSRKMLMNLITMEIMNQEVCDLDL